MICLRCPQTTTCVIFKNSWLDIPLKGILVAGQNKFFLKNFPFYWQWTAWLQRVFTVTATELWSTVKKVFCVNNLDIEIYSTITQQHLLYRAQLYQSQEHLIIMLLGIKRTSWKDVLSIWIIFSLFRYLVQNMYLNKGFDATFYKFTFFTVKRC